MKLNIKINSYQSKKKKGNKKTSQLKVKPKDQKLGTRLRQLKAAEICATIQKNKFTIKTSPFVQSNVRQRRLSLGITTTLCDVSNYLCTCTEW